MAEVRIIIVQIYLPTVRSNNHFAGYLCDLARYHVYPTVNFFGISDMTNTVIFDLAMLLCSKYIFNKHYPLTSLFKAQSLRRKVVFC